MKLLHLIFLCCLLAMFSCKPGPPAGVLSEGEMEDVLLDYHLAQCMAENSDKPDEQRAILTASALRKHGLTQAEFDSSLVWWCTHAEELDKIYERVQKRVENLASETGSTVAAKSSYTALKAYGDTADIWNMSRFALLRPNRLDNLYSFSIEADTAFHCGDKFMWAFDPVFVTSNGSPEAYIIFRIEYENDTIIAQSQRLVGNYHTEIALRGTASTDTVRLKRVCGSIFMPTSSEGFSILSISNMYLVRYHDKTVHQKPAAVAPKDSVNTPQAVASGMSDTMKVRQAPHEIRGEGGDVHSNIIKDKSVFYHKRTRRK